MSVHRILAEELKLKSWKPLKRHDYLVAPKRHLRPHQPGIAALRYQWDPMFVRPAAKRLHLGHIGWPGYCQGRRVVALARLIQIGRHSGIIPDDRGFAQKTGQFSEKLGLVHGAHHMAQASQTGARSGKVADFSSVPTTNHKRKENPMADGLMAGKRGLIMGVANNRSIGWGIAKALAGQGAELAFSYQGEALKKRVEPLAAEAGSNFLFECDVTNDAAMDEAFRQIKEKWGHLDFLVHAIGFSDKNELDGRYIDTSAGNFAMTMNISVYSFTAIAKRAEPLMSAGGSLLTLTYYGAQRYIPNYNVMGVAKAALEASVRYLAVDMGKAGIRVNAISAGAIKTLAASGISGLRDMLHWQEANAALRRNVDIDDVGKAGLYLLSDLSSGVTGEIHYVDAGFNVVGMKLMDEAAAETPPTA